MYYHQVEKIKCRSAWARGIKEYALELAANLDQAIKENRISESDVKRYALLEKTLLNGVSDWREYSYAGSSLVCDVDIAKRLCTPADLKKSNFGTKKPNRYETWLDVQARALHQAYIIMRSAIN